MRGIILILLVLFWPLVTFSQLELNRAKEALPLVGSKHVKALYSDGEESFESILQKNFHRRYDSSFVPTVEKDVWLKLTVLNTDSFLNDYYLYSKDAYYTIYLQTDTGWQTQRNGYLLPLKKRDNKKYTFFLPIQLKPSKATEIYIRLQSGNYKRSSHTPMLCTKMVYHELLYEELEYNRPSTIFTVIYLSGLTMISFFILILFISIREQVYVYYLFYLLLQILFALSIFARMPLQFMNIGLYFPIAGYAIEEGLQFLFIGFYIFFTIKLLEVKTFDLRLSRVMRWVAWFCFVYAGLSISYKFLFPHPDVIDWIFIVIRLIILPINLLLIAWVVVKVKHPLIAYFIMGNVLFFAGSVLSVYVSFTGINYNPDSFFYFGNSLNAIFQVGLLGEVLCFSFAVAHHVRLIQLDKEKTVKAYIRQLQENHLIQENMNKELDKQVNEKTDELIRVYSDIEKQREKETKFQFSQKIKEMEMLALRAQMNPHFLFNSMNAIKHLIMNGRTEAAMHYLDDFSSLLRGVLQNSKRETITVEDELEILELYLSLEKGRLGEDLNYSISVADKEALYQYPIPALLLQPFVENAIWHGLMPSTKKDKSLKIDFSIGENLIITVQDNGIGRKKAAQTADHRSNFHKSFGIQITQERLALFNHLHDLKITLKVTDLEENDTVTGTLVTLTYSDKNHD